MSSSGHAAHPDQIIESCKALQEYISKMQSDADKELKDWEESIAARELAEKRRVAPGWLDSETHILEPERKMARGQYDGSTEANLMDDDVSSADASGLRREPVVKPNGEGDELDRAFGGMGIGK